MDGPQLPLPNDIAVTVQSIQSVDRERVFPPQIQEIGCDHMSYFTHPEGLKAIVRALKQ